MKKSKKILVSLALTASLISQNSHALAASLVSGGIAPLIAGAVVFAGIQIPVVMKSEDSGQVVAGAFAASLFGVIALSEENNQTVFKPLDQKSAKQANITNNEAMAYNSELPLIAALFESAGSDYLKALKFLSSNRHVISPQAQVALGKLLATYQQ